MDSVKCAVCAKKLEPSVAGSDGNYPSTIIGTTRTVWYCYVCRDEIVARALGEAPVADPEPPLADAEREALLAVNDRLFTLLEKVVDRATMPR